MLKTQRPDAAHLTQDSKDNGINGWLGQSFQITQKYEGIKEVAAKALGFLVGGRKKTTSP